MLEPEVFTRLPALAITTSRLPDQARNHRANRIIAAITGAFRLGDSQLHEFLFWFVGRRNHADGLYLFIARVSYEPNISFELERKWKAETQDPGFHLHFG